MCMILDKNNIIDMNRGWLCKEQLDLSMPLLDCVTATEIFDIKNDIEVREYDYPNGFFEEGFSADKITSSE